MRKRTGVVNGALGAVSAFCTVFFHWAAVVGVYIRT